MRTEPLRLERYLTQDYINRAQKMREIEARLTHDPLHPMAVVLAWVVVGMIVTVALLTY